MPNGRLKVMLCWLASVGILLPAGSLPAATPVVSHESTVLARDVVLERGQLRGQSAGEAGASVRLIQRGEVLATIQSDEVGRFEFRNVTPGHYRVETPQTTTHVRCWSSEVAPPSAKRMLTVESMVVRGQLDDDFGALGMLTAGVGIAGLTLGVIGLVEAKNTQDELDELRGLISP